MKYSYITYLCILSASIGMLGSCQRTWLNAKPSQNLAVPSTLEDFQALLDDNYVMNAYWAPSLGEIASGDFYISDKWFGIDPGKEKDAYTWTHTYPYTGVSDWDFTYSRVYYANTIIEGLQGFKVSSAADQETYNNIMGQALFMRGMSIYEAAQQWAPVYDSATAATDLGVPLRTSADITIPTTRSTVQQDFDQIFSDINQAKGLLPETQVYGTRASKPAVYALLARIYLSVGDYTDAGANADTCLSISGNLLDYNTLSMAPGTTFGQYNSEVIFQGILGTDYDAFIPFESLIDSAFYVSYDSNDLRKTLFFYPQADGTIEFSGNYTLSINFRFAGLATDEMYLTRAECYARAGNTALAMQDLNTLLQTRYKTGTFTLLTATSSTDALNQILTERQKELILRGTRWLDLRRLNKDPNFAVTLSRTVAGTNYTLQPNTYQYTFPIPDDVLQASNIKQNPGW